MRKWRNLLTEFERVSSSEDDGSDGNNKRRRSHAISERRRTSRHRDSGHCYWQRHGIACVLDSTQALKQRSRRDATRRHAGLLPRNRTQQARWPRDAGGQQRRREGGCEDNWRRLMSTRRRLCDVLGTSIFSGDWHRGNTALAFVARQMKQVDG